MDTATFEPNNIDVNYTPGTKILVIARQAKIDIRFGCGACRCGTCAVKISQGAQLSDIADDEKELLSKMHLPLNGEIRLSCQARLLGGEAVIDLAFQDKYSPDRGILP